MAGTNTVNISVREMTADWRLILGDPITSMTGQRRYIEMPGGAGSTALTEQLPNIGEPWSANLPDLLVVRIETLYTHDDDNQGLRMFNVFYETRWINTQAIINRGGTGPFDEGVLEVDIEAGSESITIDPSTTGTSQKYTWETANVPVTQPLFNLVVTSTFRVKRFVIGTGMQDFVNASNDMVGKVNSTNFYLDTYEPGTVLYNGFTSHGVISEMGERKHMVELNFGTRIVTYGTGTGGDPQVEADGWNYIYNSQRPSGAPLWDRPYTLVSAVKHFIYDSADFATLWTTGLETEEIPLLEEETR